MCECTGRDRECPGGEEVDEEVGNVAQKNGNWGTLRTLFPPTLRQWSLCLKLGRHSRNGPLPNLYLLRSEVLG